MHTQGFEVELEAEAWLAVASMGDTSMHMIREKCSNLMGKTVLVDLDRYKQHQACVAAAAGMPAEDIAPPIWCSTDAAADDQDGQLQLHLAAAGKVQQQETCCIAGVRYLQHHKPAAGSPAHHLGEANSLRASEAAPTAGAAAHQSCEAAVSAGSPSAGSPSDCFMRMILTKVAQEADIGARSTLQCVVDVYPAVEHAECITVVDLQQAAAAQQAAQPLLPTQQQEPFIAGSTTAAVTTQAAATATSALQHTGSPGSSTELEPHAVAAVAAAAANNGRGAPKRRPRAAGKHNDDYEYDLGMDEPHVMRVGSQAGKRRCDGSRGGKVPETMQARRLKLKNDWNDHLCHECLNFREGTAVECDGTCLRMFHMQCLPAHLRPKPTDKADAPWYCEDCCKGVAECAVCGGEGGAAVDVFKCSMGSCGRYYHAACLLSLRSHLRFKVAPTADTVKMLKAQAAAAAGSKHTSGSTAAAAAGGVGMCGQQEISALDAGDAAAAAAARGGRGGWSFMGRGTAGSGSRRGRGSSIASRGGSSVGRGRRSRTAEEMAARWTSLGDESGGEQLQGDAGRKQGSSRGRGEGRSRGGALSSVRAYGSSSSSLLMLEDAAAATPGYAAADEVDVLSGTLLAQSGGGGVVPSPHHHQQQQPSWRQSDSMPQQWQQSGDQSPVQPVDPKRQRSRHYQGPFLTASAAAGVPDDVPFMPDEVLQGRVTCPSHYCQSCHLSGDSLKLLRCWMCPRAYHTSCLHDLATKVDFAGHKMVDCPWCKVAYNKAERQRQQQLQLCASPAGCGSGAEPFTLTRWDDPRAAAAGVQGSKKQRLPEDWNAAYLFAAAREALRNPQSVDFSELKDQAAVIRTKPGSRLSAAAAAAARGGGMRRAARGRGRGRKTDDGDSGGLDHQHIPDTEQANTTIPDSAAAAGDDSAAAAAATGRQPAGSSAAAAAALSSKAVESLHGRSWDSSGLYDVAGDTDVLVDQDAAQQQQQPSCKHEHSTAAAGAAAAEDRTDEAIAAQHVKEEPAGHAAAAAAAAAVAMHTASNATKAHPTAGKQYVRIVPLSSDGDAAAAAHASAPGMAPNIPVDLLGKSHWHFGTHYKGGGVEFQVPVPGIKLHSKLVVHEDGGVTLRPMHAPTRATPPLLNGKALLDKGLCYELSHGDIIDIGGARFLVEWHDLALREVGAGPTAAAAVRRRAQARTMFKQEAEVAAAAAAPDIAARLTDTVRTAAANAAQEILKHEAGLAAAAAAAAPSNAMSTGLSTDAAAAVVCAVTRDGTSLPTAAVEDAAAAAARVYAAVEAHLQAMAAGSPAADADADAPAAAATAAQLTAAAEAWGVAAAAAGCTADDASAALPSRTYAGSSAPHAPAAAAAVKQHELTTEQLGSVLQTADANNAAAGGDGKEAGTAEAAPAVGAAVKEQQQEARVLVVDVPTAAAWQEPTGVSSAHLHTSAVEEEDSLDDDRSCGANEQTPAAAAAAAAGASTAAAAAVEAAAAAAGTGNFRPAHRSRKQKLISTVDAGPKPAEQLPSPAKRHKHSQQQQQRAASVLEGTVSSSSTPAEAEEVVVAAVPESKRTRRTKRLSEVSPWGRQQQRSQRRRPMPHDAYLTGHAALAAAGIPSAVAACAFRPKASSRQVPSLQQQQQWWGVPARKQQQQKQQKPDQPTVSRDTAAAATAAAAAAAAHCMPHLNHQELLELTQKLLAGQAAAAAAELPVHQAADDNAAAAAGSHVGPPRSNSLAKAVDGIDHLRSIARQPQDMLARFLKPQRQQLPPPQQQQQLRWQSSGRDAVSLAITALTAAIQQQPASSVQQQEAVRHALSAATEAATAAVLQRQQQQQHQPSNRTISPVIDSLAAHVQQQQQTCAGSPQHGPPVVSSGARGPNAASVEALTAALSSTAAPAPAAAETLADLLRRSLSGNLLVKTPSDAQLQQVVGLAAMQQRLQQQQPPSSPQQQQQQRPLQRSAPTETDVTKERLAAAAATAAALADARSKAKMQTTDRGPDVAAAAAASRIVEAEPTSGLQQQQISNLPAMLTRLLNPGGGNAAAAAVGQASAQDPAALIAGLRQGLQALADAKGLPIRFT